jgi:S-formylglutathione hydrolase
MKELNAWKMFGGMVKQFTHESTSTKTAMRFSIFLPAASETGPVPVLYYLSGLTCTDDNFTQKACAQRAANELGVAIVAPDTSPRGCEIEGEDDAYDFGAGAGFYVNATESKWATNYNMYDYVTQELPALIESEFPVSGKRAITGHSMGGHGALVCALKNPDKYTSVSAFAPIVHPTQCPWGQKAFNGYLGSVEAGLEYDATELMKANSPFHFDDILIDQGTADNFLEEQLMPAHFEEACADAGQKVTVRMQEGYDHSYFFMASFMDEHIRYHAAKLNE